MGAKEQGYHVRQEKILFTHFLDNFVDKECLRCQDKHIQTDDGVYYARELINGMQKFR